MAAAVHDVFPSRILGKDDDWSTGGSHAIFSPGRAATESLQTSLIEFARLPANWDSYGASKITRDAIDAALDTLSELVSTGVPLPHLVPTPCGGIQAEWHSGSKSLELEFVSPVQIEFYFEDESTAQVEEETLSFDLSPVYRRIAEL